MKVTDIIAESKQPKDAPKPRNFVAKNAINTGAGQHKDKKRAEKQGDVKHKKQAVPMDEQGVAEGKEDKIAQLKKDYDTAVHWSKNEKSPQKREAARQKAEKIKAHLEKQYKQGVAEGSLDDIEDTKQFRDAVALAKTQKAIRQAKYGKDTKFYADGTPVTPKEVARRAAERKARQQGVAEVSKATIDRYVSKASDAHGDADFKARMSKHDPDKISYHVDQKKTAEKRRQGISRALDRMSRQESVEEGDNDWSDSQGNFAGDKPFNLGGDVAKRLDVNDTVSYFGEKATILAMSKDRTVSRIDLKSGITQNVKTLDLKRVGHSMGEATSVAVRMQRAADKQRAKSDASLARTPSSIPKKEEPKKS